MDMGSIAAAIGSLKTASDIAKAFVGVRDGALIQGKVIELQSVILNAQDSILSAKEAQTTLLEQISALKAKVAQFEKWDTEKQKYELKKVYPGAFAYALKPDTNSAEPPHWICPSCFEQRKKSILQQLNATGHTRRWGCPKCSAEIRVFTGVEPDKPHIEPKPSSTELSPNLGDGRDQAATA